MNIFSQIIPFVGNAYTWTKHYVRAHKIISGIVLVLLLGGGWYTYGAMTSTKGETRYVLGTVATSTIISTVSASGQVSATNQVDIKPKVSGDITWVGVKAGQTVAAGQALATIDSTDAQQAVTNAKISLQSEELTLAQDTAEAPINYQKSKDDVAQAQTDLANQYDDVFSTLTSVYSSLPGIMTEAHDLLYANDFSANNENVDTYKNSFINSNNDAATTINIAANRAEQDYTSAFTAYNSAYAGFKLLTRSSSTSDIEKSLNDANSALKLISQALGSDVNLIDTTIQLLNTYNKNISSTITSQQTSAHTQLSSSNSLLSQISSEVRSLQSAKTSVTTAQQNLQIASIGNTDGTNPFSLQQEQNAVEQKKAALASAQQDLADHTVRAPFAGLLSAVDANVGDSAGSSAIATIITKQQVAEISVNEVDAAKISVGEKVTLTFDAIEDLTLTGTVAELDSVGTVSQGVVSYAVKITFDTQDSRIKPGMTVNADIQSAVHQDVLSVPSSAVKTINGASYVMIFTPALAETGGTQGVTSTTPPTQVPVEIGISDDTNVEILSGLNAGEQVVIRTTTGTATAAAATTRAGAAPTGATRGGAAGGFGGGAGIRL